MPQTIHLPETMANWPLPRRLNPHYAAVVQQSAEWISSFGAFGPKAQTAFDKCNIGEYSCRGGPVDCIAYCSHLRRSPCHDELSDAKPR